MKIQIISLKRLTITSTDPMKMVTNTSLLKSSQRCGLLAMKVVKVNPCHLLTTTGMMGEGPGFNFDEFEKGWREM
jgi:hypothetical protein